MTRESPLSRVQFSNLVILVSDVMTVALSHAHNTNVILGFHTVLK